MQIANLLVPPASPVLDDFNRANENPVSQAGAWNGKPVSTDLAMQVLTNELASSDTVNFNFAGQIYNLTLADCEVVATITGTASQLHYLYLRTADEGGAAVLDGYCIEVSGGAWRILRETNTTQTPLGAGFSKTVSTGDMTAIRAVGQIIQAWHRTAAGVWTLLAVRTDSTYASGRIGVRTNGPNIRFDNFSGGSIEVVPGDPSEQFDSSPGIGPF